MLFGDDQEETLRDRIEEAIDEHEDEGGKAPAGDLAPIERQMLRNLLHFGERDAGDVGVPRADIVAVEVALFNVALALFMHNLFPMPNDAHKEDMLAFMAQEYIGAWGEWPVRIIGGLWKRTPLPVGPAAAPSTTRSVAAELRCPVCQGESILDSPAELAQQMRAIVKEKLRAGEAKAVILTMDHPAAALHAVNAVRHAHPSLPGSRPDCASAHAAHARPPRRRRPRSADR